MNALRKNYLKKIVALIIIFFFVMLIGKPVSANLSVQMNGRIITDNVNFRVAPVSGKIIRVIKKGEAVRVITKNENWCKVVDKYGKIGYVYSKYVKYNINTKSYSRINLVWDPDYKKTIAESVYETTGLNVISPTWFTLGGWWGKINYNMSDNYINQAHKNKQKVWVLFSNNFDIDMTHKFLRSAYSRSVAIKTVVELAKKHKIDGINLDFEKIYEQDKNYYTLFVKELHAATQKNKLVLSVDVTGISNSAIWSKCFDRKAIAVNSEYVIFMGYDQHSKGTAVGSVAELTWVEKNVQRLISEVPTTKLVLGVPFYTRLWMETTDEAGRVNVDSKVLNMNEAYKFFKDNKAKIIWDKSAGQNYVDFKKNNVRYRIWIEDSESISLKAGLVSKYKLAGIAAWRKGFEDRAVWKTISNNLKK